MDHWRTQLNLILGIDVGKNGGLAYIDSETCKIVKAFEVPKISDKVVDLGALWDIFRDNPYDHAFIEDVHAFFGSTATASFEFGGMRYVKEMCLVAMGRLYGRPYSFIGVSDWQKRCWSGVSKVMKNGKHDTKKTSLIAAKRLFPDWKFTAQLDGITDAALIAYAGRMKIL